VFLLEAAGKESGVSVNRPGTLQFSCNRKKLSPHRPSYYFQGLSICTLQLEPNLKTLPQSKMVFRACNPFAISSEPHIFLACLMSECHTQHPEILNKALPTPHILPTYYFYSNHTLLQGCGRSGSAPSLLVQAVCHARARLKYLCLLMFRALK
jgi:hypothetical protein